MSALFFVIPILKFFVDRLQRVCDKSGNGASVSSYQQPSKRSVSCIQQLLADVRCAKRGTFRLGGCRVIRAVVAVRDSDADIPPLDKSILQAIATYCFRDEMVAFPSISQLAQATGRHTKTVRKTLHRLIKVGILVDTGRRAGQTKQISVYEISLPSGGSLKDYHQEGGFQAERLPSQSERLPSRPKEQVTEQVTKSTLLSVGRNGANPIEEEIYQAYPRKVSKPQALRAIRKALAHCPGEKLLQLTRDYATARADAEERYTPHPATWFNGERFNDDPSTWVSSSSSQPYENAI
jgi:hypothetical protein